jgi:hypothetical protein
MLIVPACVSWGIDNNLTRKLGAADPLQIAALFMPIGVYLHLTEAHDHEHLHEPRDHEQGHVHDIHRQHEHVPDDPGGEPHNHPTRTGSAQASALS